MKHTALHHQVQHLCDSIATELYNLAFYIYGNQAEASAASSDTFIKAYAKISVNPTMPDTEQFKQLCFKLLFQYGSINRFTNTKLHPDKENKLYTMLRPLSYNERFIILLFCCHKMQKEQISELLCLPEFLVAKWLLSASQKFGKAGSEAQPAEGFLMPVSSHF
jgi:DNA-directed RNA polymerase specialized sigma24 family protein